MSRHAHADQVDQQNLAYHNGKDPPLMMQSYKLAWKTERDGVGFYYGTVQGAGGIRRVDLLPPETLMDMPVMLRTVRADPVRWVVYLDGVEVARADTRPEVEAALLFRLFKSNWPAMTH